MTIGTSGFTPFKIENLNLSQTWAHPNWTVWISLLCLCFNSPYWNVHSVSNIMRFAFRLLPLYRLMEVLGVQLCLAQCCLTSGISWMSLELTWWMKRSEVIAVSGYTSQKILQSIPCNYLGSIAALFTIPVLTTTQSGFYLFCLGRMMRHGNVFGILCM